MRLKSLSREHQWDTFRRALSRFGRLLMANREPAGGFRQATRAKAHPLFELVAGDAGVTQAIGAVAAHEDERAGVLSWGNVRQAGGKVTLRINHKGTQERCRAALDAMIAALRKAGRRVGYRDLIRLPNQNGYVALVTVPDIAPALGFAR